MYKVALDFFFLLMFFEGAIRKWLLPSFSIEIQVLRDLLPAIAALLYLFRPGTAKPAMFQGLGPAFHTLLLLYVIVCFAQLLNPDLPSLLIGILGLRTHLSYVFLAHLMPPYLYEWRSALTRFQILLMLTIPICALAIFQTTQPPDSAWNLYANGEEASAFFGDSLFVRATGTFSYITGMSVFAQFAAIFSLTLLLAARRCGIRVPLAYASMTMGVGGAIATGSRAEVFGIALQVVLLLVLIKVGPARRQHSVRGILTVIGAVVLAVSAAAFEQVNAFAERAENTSDVGWRVEAALFGWADILVDEPWGVGVGAGHQAASTLGYVGFLHKIEEEELSRVALELGVGFVAYIAVRFYVLFFLLGKMTIARSVQSSAFLAFAISQVIFGLIGALYTPVTNALFWTSIGLAIWAINPISNANAIEVRLRTKFDVLRRLVKGY